ncbi:hypothetical protein HAZT_HAZT006897 [Hyalella azteca]|uniref:Heme-binding protein 2 n=1 Tax=Hyalella azteca TaxID=294128 RepID=A0A6A0GRS4_HYAAZ|nr:hypothetical protein HAZT_HAZT006897 [Hyalella azteca]
MQGPERDSLVSPMFRKLFNYISGKNELNLRMDMTTPVATYIEPGAGPTCASTFTMSFFVPEEHQSSPPNGVCRSNNTFHRRFGGYAPDEAVAKEAKELAELLQAAGETDVDFTHYYVVGYDPPFKPINRRNEIWFIKKSKPASPSE